MELTGHSNKLETNVQAETKNFGIGDASVVIDILRNRLYEHKVQTLVQEYICNARDAMRECGKGNEFEVTVPTQLNPVFKVRDFGPGISPDRMENVFIMYGASTKRGNNVQTGGFGIGAKSAWSYTDSFTITTFIDGIKRVYVAHTGVNNNGRLDHVSTTQTNEPNGTEIQVPVNKYDVHEFKSAIFRAIYFWTEKPTLKGEADGGPTLTKGFMVNDGLEIIDSRMLPGYIGCDSWRDNMLAVIDGVPYLIGEKLKEKCKKLLQLKELTQKSVILHFGNGVVEVSASRESIADSKHSLAALEKLATKGVVAIKTLLTDSFGKVNSSAEYFKTYRELSEYFVVDSFAKYGTYSINGGWIKSDLFKKVKMTVVSNLGKRNRVTEKIFKTELSDTKKDIDLKHIANLYFLKAPESAVQSNKRLREWLNPNRTTMILLEPLNGDVASLDQVIADLGAKDFTSLTWTEKPKEERVKIVREKQEFCLHSVGYGTRHVYTTLADNTQEWLYVPLTDDLWTKTDLGELRDLDEHLRKQGKRICGVAERAEKMVKGDKNFSPLSVWLKDWEPSKKELNFVKKFAAKHVETMQLVCKLPDLQDDVLVDAAKSYKGFAKDEIDILPEMLANKARQTDEYKEFEKKDKELGKILNQYPLLSQLSYYGRNMAEDVALYVNAKFKANNK